MSIDDLAARVLEQLKARGLKLSLAESCTGGLIASTLTDVPGSSEAFWGGLVAYDNQAKISVLGVDRALLESFGAVSPQSAGAMAQGALSLAARGGADGETPEPRVALSTTGIAGPGGASSLKPVGLCYSAIAWQGAPTEVLEIRAPRGLSRRATKRYFARVALARLEARLKRVSTLPKKT